MAAMTDACPAVRRQGLECLNSLARSHLRELVVNAILGFPAAHFVSCLTGSGPQPLTQEARMIRYCGDMQ